MYLGSFTWLLYFLLFKLGKLQVWISCLRVMHHSLMYSPHITLNSHRNPLLAIKLVVFAAFSLTCDIKSATAWTIVGWRKSSRLKILTEAPVVDANWTSRALTAAGVLKPSFAMR